MTPPNVRVYRACSKKDRTFAIKTLFFNILSTVPFKVVPSTDDAPFSTFLPSLECFLERTFCDGAQFSYRIFLNLRLFKKRSNFLNSSTTNAHSETGQMAVCCQNLPLGGLSSRSSSSVPVGELFKKFGLFLNTCVSPHGCYVLSTVECFPTFKRNFVPSSSWNS